MKLDAMVAVLAECPVALLAEMKTKGWRNLIRVNTVINWRNDRLNKMDVNRFETVEPVDQQCPVSIDLVERIRTRIQLCPFVKFLQAVKIQYLASPCSKVVFLGIVIDHNSIEDGHF